MATTDVLTNAYNLHLRPDGRWVASCPDCGFELAEGWHEGKAAAKAARHPCPVCYGIA
jgi:predicted RNA-binding Zn-ribbon protein involved in translation (DUF1610 family)